MADLAAIIEEYVTAAEAALTPTPQRIIRLQPGETATWDSPCGGQMWARIASITSGPNQAKANGVPCSIPWFVVTLALGVIRCIAVVSDDAVAPDAATITREGGEMLADLEALREVVLCSDRTTGDVLPSWTPLGPQGGAAGGEWTFSVRIGTCSCAEE